MSVLRLFLLCLAFLTGCVTQVDNLNEIGHRSASIAEIKTTYFTSHAQYLIRDIPCVSGITISGSYVIGANFWGSLWGILSGQGLSRKCVLDPDTNVNVNSIIHEYLHHIFDIDRDRGLGLINLEEFEEALEALRDDPEWKPLYYYAMAGESHFFTKVFGLGKYSEAIAYIGGRMAYRREGPAYMWWVYRKILRYERRNGKEGDGMGVKHHSAGK